MKLYNVYCRKKDVKVLFSSPLLIIFRRKKQVNKREAHLVKTNSTKIFKLTKSLKLLWLVKTVKCLQNHLNSDEAIHDFQLLAKVLPMKMQTQLTTGRALIQLI